MKAVKVIAYHYLYRKEVLYDIPTPCDIMLKCVNKTILVWEHFLEMFPPHKLDHFTTKNPAENFFEIAFR